MEDTFQLKEIFNEKLVHVMARNLRTVHPDFDTNLFCERTVTELDLLELKQRAQLIADSLHQHLPKDYEEAIAVLIALMKIPLDTSDQLIETKLFL